MLKQGSLQKSNGRLEQWDDSKLIKAVNKAAARAGETIDFDKLIPLVNKSTSVSELYHKLMVALQLLGYEKTAESYSQYRSYKKEFGGLLMEVWEKTQKALAYGDKSNANVDSLIISSKQSLVRGYVSKELYKHNFLTVDEQEAIQDGYIYIHDLDQLLYPQINCCLFDIGAVMRGGFEMANTKYTEPQSLRTALQLISDIILCASSQQFGGFTVPELDKILVPYYERSLDKHLVDAYTWNIQDAYSYAVEKTEDELKQGLQALSLKTNTIPSSRGDFAFTTVTFGLLDDPETAGTQKNIAKAILRDRMSYDTPPVFPKLVYLYNEETDHEDLFDLAIECSCRCLYPDFLSLSGEGYVPDMYRKHGKAISPMGCRAFLSEGCGSFVGRANIGAVSLNLPMIYMKEGDFWENLRFYMEMIRTLHKKRYEYLAKAPCSTNPLAFTQGGLMGGTKQPDEPIGDIVKNFTASFGITALNELNMLKEGKPLHESEGSFVNEVLGFINNLITEYKEADENLYALYATPAESLCGTQVQQFRNKYGIIAGVSDREYFSNSFHMHVSAEISPFRKQDLEYQFFHQVTGGRIQYTRLDTDKPNVVKGVILRGMMLGFYSGVNGNKCFCQDCAHNANYEMLECDKCGSTNIAQIDRVCGYLGFTRVSGDTRMNKAKLQEIKDRRSM